MGRSGGRVVLVFLAAAGIGLAGTVGTAQNQRPSALEAGGGLTAFKSDAELRAFLKKARSRNPQYDVQEMAVPSPVVPPPPPPPPAAEAQAGYVVVTGSRKSAPSITNNQTAGVDEGGIVKMRGETMVILRRGRLFTVSLAGGGRRPVDSIDAFPPGVSGQGDWYDEMLVSGDRVIVVGYSYARGGTEINRFRLDPAGRLRFEDAYHLRSNDYYSSRNYASRLIGTKLVYYTPLYLGHGRDPLDNFYPGIRRWRGGSGERAFQRIGDARRIYIPPAMRDGRNVSIDALHSVMTCDLAAVTLDCDAVGILGPSSRTFYVSGSAVYLWISDAWSGAAGRRGAARSYIYRLPLGRERPSAVGARGAPVDQFSFREDAGDGVLNVLLRAEGGDDAMFRPEFSAGSVALLRVPIRAFGDGSREAASTRYRFLPSPGENIGQFHNRFVGGHILYGGGGHDYRNDRAIPATLVAAPVRGGRVDQIRLPHGITRIEAIGPDGLAVGTGEAGLSFSAIELSPGGARLGDRYTLEEASEGESRSHAFFFDPDEGSRDGRSGTLGLPVARTAPREFRRFFGTSAAMLFLRRDARRFSPAGELEARARGVVDDGCQASCVDWYGNARPIFLGPRTFALLGYELVEGRLRGGTIREIGRTDFSPRRSGRR